MSVRPIQLAWHVYHNYLNGVFCIYKPTGWTTINSISVLKRNLLKDLNELPAYDYEVKEYFQNRFSLESTDSKARLLLNAAGGRTGGVNPSQSKAVIPTDVPRETHDFSKHKQVLGNVFLKPDLPIRHLHGIGQDGSGVVVCGIGPKGRETIELIRLAKYLRVYHVKGRLGYATDSFFPSGNFIERTTYKHITKAKLDKYCAAVQSLHQSKMFECAGIDSTSQEAYELACQGLIRPANDQMPPLLYGVKCIYFNPPDFTLEVHAIIESTEYLGELINDVGLRMKSTAVCTHVHRLRYGIFNLDHALLKKHWNLKDIVKNITKCQSEIRPKDLMTSVQLGSGYNDSANLKLSGKTSDKSVEDIIKEQKSERLAMLREQIKNFDLKDSSVNTEENNAQDTDLQENKNNA